MKRSRLARKTPLRSTGRRSTPTAPDDNELARREARRTTVAAAAQRDGDCLGRFLDPGHRCLGGLVGHELKKRSAGGSTTEIGNVAIVCARLNSEIEDWPDYAHRLGLVARFGETSEDCWARMADVLGQGPVLDGVRCPNTRSSP